MIYGSSHHPVLVKKINLKIWTLRDEIEAIIQKRLEDQEGQEDQQCDVNDLIQEYKAKELVTEKPLAIIDGEKISDGEDEMLQAMQEAQEADETPELAEVKESKENSEINEEIRQHVEVLRRVPDLAKDKIYSGKMLLAEIDMQYIYFFCEQKFFEGQSIVLDFQIPMRFVANANILYCRPYNMKSRIISANRLPYRVAARFTFLKEGERTLLRNFISSIEPTLEEIMPIKKIQSSEPSEDFDELDDFDL
jgi:hypothetical protein